MRRWWAVLGMLGLVLAGCTTATETPAATPTLTESVADLDPASLVDARTPYIGDNSAVLAALGAVGLPVGDFTMEIHSDAEPYGLGLALSEWPEDVDRDEAMTRRSALLLGLIGNAEYIEWSGPGSEPAHRVDVADADAATGRDVKDALQDEAGAREVLDALG
ncbi:MAG: DUF4825 domain-containing protein [Mobilicoccus sp.]|nr:DUF4825 domain-containing protein [Mobilicoccus sp.]